MAAVRGALVLLGCVAAAFAEVAAWDGLRVRWSINGSADLQQSKAFFDMPKTASDAVSSGWVKVPDYDVTTYCLQDDPRVCMLYDAKGVAAGIDVGVLVDDVSRLDVDYDWDSQEMFVKTKHFGIPIYRARAYWVSKDVVTKGRSTWKNGLGSGLWLEGKHGRVQIPIEQADILRDTLYTKQACIPTMGTHYYYNMSTEFQCSQFSPFFLMLDNTGKLCTVGFQTYGTPSVKSRKWFEDITPAGVRIAVPNSPDCLTEWVRQFGIISLHIYLRNDPLGIQC